MAIIGVIWHQFTKHRLLEEKPITSIHTASMVAPHFFCLLFFTSGLLEGNTSCQPLPRSAHHPSCQSHRGLIVQGLPHQIHSSLRLNLPCSDLCTHCPIAQTVSVSCA
eukprot:1139743-Pelagomonas_calceolata.AAC.13